MTHPDLITDALRAGGRIDMTTTGRKTGQPRRIEIALLYVDGRFWITGFPGPRAWMANLKADPHLTVHLKNGLMADLPATARIVTDEAERRAVLEQASLAWKRQHPVDEFVAGAPLIEVIFDDESLTAE